MRHTSSAVIASVLLAVFSTCSQANVLIPARPDHPLDWKKLPALPGTQVAVLAGDPDKKGFFIVRLKFPANFKIAPHYHNITEHDMVISGTFYLGEGNKFELNKTIPMTAGSYITILPKIQHYGWTQDETILQVSGIGPWGAVYDNAAGSQPQSSTVRIPS